MIASRLISHASPTIANRFPIFSVGLGDRARPLLPAVGYISRALSPDGPFLDQSVVATLAGASGRRLAAGSLAA